MVRIVSGFLGGICECKCLMQLGVVLQIVLVDEALARIRARADAIVLVK